MNINAKRLIENLESLGEKGILDGKRSRVAASDEDKAGRDYLVSLIEEAGLEVVVDRIGNIFGIWKEDHNKDQTPVMIGSHIDSVIDAGQYDGCYGVISGLEVIRSLKENDIKTKNPLIIGAFTNEEGIRYQPDMMGSLVYAGGLGIEEALNTVGIDGTVLGDELKRIGYEGTVDPGFVTPKAYIELHVEQGPILDTEGISVGAVENLQGISWQNVVIKGEQNHAGTTPTNMRKDAGIAAAKVNTYLRERCIQSEGTTVATVGTIAFEPNSINVIPSKATFTVDLRNPDNEILKCEEKLLKDFYKELEKTEGVEITSEQLVRFDPVQFNEGILNLIEKSAENRGFTHKKMTSGAGHDAQMMARITDVAMIFVPSIGGISHNSGEKTADSDLEAGANVLLDVIRNLVEY